MAVEVRLPAFEGPLDLLLHLIEKNQVDIYDIPVYEITQQYLACLDEWNKKNMEIASEFIVMAATLINIKAKMLLPVQKEEAEEAEDPREELIRRLLEYKRYKEAAAGFRIRHGCGCAAAWRSFSCRRRFRRLRSSLREWCRRICTRYMSGRFEARRRASIRCVPHSVLLPRTLIPLRRRSRT